MKTMAKENVRVIIAEDHVVLRQGLKLLVEQDENLAIVGEAGNGQQVLDTLSDVSTDVVLMDVNMPVMDGYEATKRVRSSYPDTKVIALSMHNNLPYVQKMLNCGASGYLLKTTNQDELCAAIKLVAGGMRYIGGELSIQLLERTATPDAYQEPMTGEEKGLSKREVEVLSLIAEGYTNVQMADKLFTSKRTIETHRQNIMEKTQAKNTANLVKYAIENKIIGIGSPKQ